MIPASYFEAYCFGSELDKRVVQGYAIGQPNRKFKEQNIENLPKFNIFTNFKEYSLQMPDIICMDVAKDCFKLKEFFDSIICDPPYGLRAAILTSEKKEER